MGNGQLLSIGSVMTEDDRAAVAAAAELLSSADSLLVITGPSLVADSGLPVYRGIAGLYEVSDHDDGFPIEVVLSQQMLEQRPELAWKHIGRIESAYRRAQPGHGHEVIAAFEERLERVWVVTQNLGGLHRQAGSRNVLELFGSLHNLMCIGCGDFDTVRDNARLAMPPKCRACGAVMRPEIVLFGDRLPSMVVRKLEDQLEEGFDLVLAVGVTSDTPHITRPLIEARDMGTSVVAILGRGERLDEDVDHIINGGATEVLDAIWRAL